MARATPCNDHFLTSSPFKTFFLPVASAARSPPQQQESRSVFFRQSGPPNFVLVNCPEIFGSHNTRLKNSLNEISAPTLALLQ